MNIVVMHFTTTPGDISGVFGIARDNEVVDVGLAEIADARATFIDYFLDLRRQFAGETETQVILYISDTAVRALIKEQSGQSPWLRVVDMIAGPTLSETFYTLRAAMCACEPRPTVEPNRPTLRVVATDASKSRGSTVCGISYVKDTGTIQTAVVSAQSVTGAEFRAVDLAIRKCAKSSRPLLILTDSLTVANVLEGKRSHSCAEASVCLHTLEFNRRMGRQVHVQWVKGHAGHVLNEFADRAAVLRRRHAQWGVDRAMTRKSLRLLKSEFKNQLCLFDPEAIPEAVRLLELSA